MKTPIHLICGVLLAAWASGGIPAAPASDPFVSYEIQAVLDTGERSVRGEEWVTFRNPSQRPLSRLLFHLYANAFRNTETVFMRESVQGNDLRAKTETIRRGTWGYIQIEGISLEDGTDLSTTTNLRETLMEVTLPEELASGETIRVRIRFTTRLPRTIARMGYRGDHYDVMQWFPKVAALVDGEWNRHDFHADSEFFADFGTYDVTLSLPREYVVEATGERIEDRTDPGTGTRTVRYRARNVHDFAWIADPNFREARETYRGVEIVYLHQPYHESQVERILAAIRTCLDFYGEHFMEYPYPRVIIDDLPMGMGGGMEYPMLFTISIHWAQPSFLQSPENLTIHEFGHQYWHGIMASNEFEEPWLDEGINTYVSSLVEDEYWGSRGKGETLPTLFRFALARTLRNGLDLAVGPWRLGLTDLVGFQVSPFRQNGPSLLGIRLNPNSLQLEGFPDPTLLDARESYGSVAGTDPIATRAWEFLPGSYGPTVYDKTYLMMKTLERMVGRDAVLAALREYVRRFRFLHPTGSDLTTLLQEITGKDLSGVFSQLLYGMGTLDYSIQAAESVRVEDPTGFLPQDRIGDPLEDRRFPDSSEEDANPLFRTEVILYRNGEVQLPVDVELRFQDGSVHREQWNGQERWKRLVIEKPSQLLSAELDPGFVHVLDLDRNNNSWTAEVNWKPLAKLSAIWMFWMQNLLHLFASLS